MFWVGERTQTPCCRFANDDDLDDDPDMFDCSACDVAARLDDMDAENQRAWDLAHLLCTRFLHDTHTAAAALTRLTVDLDEIEFADLLRRLTLIYDVLVPAPQKRE